jgi:hypothetical protein
MTGLDLVADSALGVDLGRGPASMPEIGSFSSWKLGATP